ncbi:NADH-ubiquinone oxidoreductase chain 4 (mitochondrion) [[Candida] railenensis]|uniref:NADH-ubiquinone oxidoreductase chain 4 n=1 Tax=[Candida] railenensis TaxID=45579 RepID=UPI002027A4A6|nr:NADH-ubiquinone oxidoreductase chain 4 [[Candida] railenensis]CAH2356107.1 NADH-ubiquinone oxidoreductase chain 4 [[Candida] railenensis]
MFYFITNYFMILNAISMFTLSAVSSYLFKVLPSTSKQIMLIASILISLPTLYSWNELGVYYTTDGIADTTMLLTLYLLPISMLSNWNNINSSLYFELVLYTGLIMLMNFMCQDMTSFYVFFEASLAPLFMLIGIYGASNKDKAADYMLMYTLLSSLFMLLAMALYHYLLGSTDYQTTSLVVLSIDLQCILFLAMSIGMAVKTPLVPLHTWLPVVHSESPLAGSILLAGILTKLAIYGIMRLMLPTLTDASVLFTPVIYIIAIITMMYTSMMTLRQTDLKVIMAYSSMSHMAVCMLGMFSNNLLGLNGSIMLSLAHGFVSPALFIIVGGILYDRYHNRLMYYYQGLITYMPVLSFYLMFISFCNMGAPLSVNFMGELLSLTGAMSRAPITGSLAAMSVLLSASYQLKLTNRLTGGVKVPFIKLTADCTYREQVLLISLIVPTMMFGIWPSYMSNIIEWDLTKLLYLFIV